ncbi:hypothetical protein IWZ01DRAFT_542741 [Phyllosticta capitalensis]
MRSQILAAALISFISACVASPLTEASPSKCNKDYDPAACGACHYWKNCLTKDLAWIYPCAACDFTSWCNCTAPAGVLGPEPGTPIVTISSSALVTPVPTPRNATAIFKHVLPN